MKKRDFAKTRTDRPSGRQASEQPEHQKKSGTAPETLHQGQGPDFTTQGRSAKERNAGVKQLEKLDSRQSEVENNDGEQGMP